MNTHEDGSSLTPRKGGLPARKMVDPATKSLTTLGSAPESAIESETELSSGAVEHVPGEAVEETREPTRPLAPDDGGRAAFLQCQSQLPPLQKSVEHLETASNSSPRYHNELVDHRLSTTGTYHNPAQGNASELGFVEGLKRMYGTDSYDEKLAELGTLEHEGSVRYPTKSQRILLLISAILPYSIVSCPREPSKLDSFH